jgi:hypothetical protein
MRKIIFIIGTIGVLFFSLKTASKTPERKSCRFSTEDNLTEQRLLNRVKTIKKFISDHSKYNDQLAFFIDMQIMSGKNRFFVYDLKNDKIIDQGLVAHGLGSEAKNGEKLKFSNVSQSLCTALGKYSIGGDYFGRFGKAYKLYGLDKTNNKAFERNIVLHKYDKVPCEEQDKAICNSYGCPMVNAEYYSRIQKIIDHSRKNIILDIYY